MSAGNLFACREVGTCSEITKFRFSKKKSCLRVKKGLTSEYEKRYHYHRIRRLELFLP